MTMRPRKNLPPLPIRVFAILLAWSLLLPQVAQARFQPTSGFDLFSSQQEVQLGQQAATRTRQQMPILPDSDPVARYVQQLGARLAAHAPGTEWPYSFHVVQESDINAFALPGGPVYVNLGTIQAAENESELAGVMAHEISHVVQRHATRAASQEELVQVPLSVLGGFFGRSLGGQLTALAAQFTLGSYFLKNSRDHEKQADLLGTDIMYDAGYDPRYMARFFEIIKQKYPSRAPQFLSDHPDPGNRIEYVDKEIASLQPKRYSAGTGEFAEIHQRALGIKAYTPQQIQAMQKSNGGGVATGVAPSGQRAASESFSEFRHQAYTIRHPQNWQVMGDQSSSVTIAPPDAVSEDAVAYGVIISGFQPESASIDGATHELVTRLRQGNPELRQIGYDQAISVNGVPGKSVDLVGSSPQKTQDGRTQRERDWVVVLPLSNRQEVLYAVFISPDSNYAQLHPTFEEMLRTLHVR